MMSQSTMKLDIILGCMFSGKSTELMRRCQKASAIGRRVIIINHSLDNRNTSDVIQTHNKQTHQAFKTDSLMRLYRETHWIEYDMIGIDEAQFFDDLYEFILTIEPLGKHVILSGLDGDIHRKPFGQILQCIPLCDTVVKLHAYDMIDRDFTPAIFSQRIELDSKEQVVVGAEEKYIAVSRKNYLARL